ncbi:MAG TPA: MBL fold metallo-hydrolase [Polyangiaceae bacterium]|nr:MBL fold metallo-hydrolase [Polyangiaceae bacterium]
MFLTTFLGHQGWAFSAGTTTVFVDPLLRPGIGQGADVAELFPPRVWGPAAPPPVAAVLLTHEHEDHFDIPSLARVDRAVPILLSGGSSSSAETALVEMGFRVRRVYGGERVVVGDLELYGFSPDHLANDNSDEWDVLQFLVRDAAGHGSFFSGVDAIVSAETESAVRAITDRRGLWCATNNSTNWSFTRAGRIFQANPPLDTLRLASQIAADEAQLRWRWAPPAGLLFCGSGYSFSGARAWLNRNVFYADSERIAAALASLLPGELVLAPAPGQTISMQGGSVAGCAARAPYLAAASRDAWPDRTYAGDVALMDVGPPLSGRHELSPRELDEVRARLGDFAAFLYGGAEFRTLYSAPERRFEGRRLALAVVLLADEDGGAYVVEYDPTSCTFKSVEVADPAAEYAFGIECWGSDLLEALRGEAGPLGLAFGGARTWSYGPPGFEFSLRSLWAMLHPLRRPNEFLALYRKLAASAGEGPPLLRADPGRPIEVGRFETAAKGRREGRGDGAP